MAVLLVLLSPFAAPSTSAAPVDPAVPAPIALDPGVEAVRVPMVAWSTCSDVPALIADAIQAGRDLAACITAEPGVALPKTTAGGPIPPPSNCGTQGYYTMTRFWMCGVWLNRLNFIDTRTGAIVGTLEYGVVDYIYSSNTSVNFMHQVQWDFHAATGVGQTLPQTISGRASCTGNCYVNTLDFPSQPATVGRQAYATALNTTTATTSGAIAHSSATTYYHFTGSNGTSTEGSITAPRIRCDNAMPGTINTGCAFDQFVPTMQYSRSGSRAQVAAHIQQAQASGLPGSASARSFLHRLTNSTLTTKNGSTACGSPPPAPLAPAGSSCDEYPFRSTYEGAYTGGGTARTQAGCYYVIVNPSTGSSGYSICSVNLDQNRNAGADLGGFYTRNRVINADPFMVEITP
ncbi:hypothetical protein GCM10010531_18680 [Blastococcus jejuensis]|uniref:Deoxyribonuclease NucA/NucB domain-containing protein n=1 Tax=Blastococcus jejuensis TaxID=351224 RepID=A0ABP6P3G1_9ACTN